MEQDFRFRITKASETEDTGLSVELDSGSGDVATIRHDLAAAYRTFMHLADEYMENLDPNATRSARKIDLLTKHKKALQLVFEDLAFKILDQADRNGEGNAGGQKEL